MVARKRKPLAAKDTNQQAAELDTARDPKKSEASAKAQQIIDDLDARGDSFPSARSPGTEPQKHGRVSKPHAFAAFAAICLLSKPIQIS